MSVDDDQKTGGGIDAEMEAWYERKSVLDELPVIQEEKHATHFINTLHQKGGHALRKWLSARGIELNSAELINISSQHRSFFNLFDRDGNGSISPGEARIALAMMEMCGMTAYAKKLFRARMRQIQRDNFCNEISLEQFTTIMEFIRVEESKHAALETETQTKSLPRDLFLLAYNRKVTLEDVQERVMTGKAASQSDIISRATNELRESLRESGAVGGTAVFAATSASKLMKRKQIQRLAYNAEDYDEAKLCTCMDWGGMVHYHCPDCYRLSCQFLPALVTHLESSDCEGCFFRDHVFLPADVPITALFPGRPQDDPEESDFVKRERRLAESQNKGTQRRKGAVFTSSSATTVTLRPHQYATEEAMLDLDKKPDFSWAAIAPVRTLPGSETVQLVSSYRVVLGLKETGDVFQWGIDMEGPPFFKTERNSERMVRPMLVPLPERVVQIACGVSHCLALTESREVYSWGEGRGGRCGTGSITDVRTPTRVATLSGRCTVQIACGELHSLALIESGNLFSWGDGRYGQLGIGSLSDCSLPQTVNLIKEPVIHIGAGANFSAALTKFGQVYSFGCGWTGALGHGEHVASLDVPVAIESLASKNIVMIAAGAQHMLAVERGRNHWAGDVLWSWGDNCVGKLGHADYVEHFSPRVVDCVLPRTKIVRVMGGVHCSIYAVEGNEEGYKYFGVPDFQFHGGAIRPELIPSSVSSLETEYLLETHPKVAPSPAPRAPRSPAKKSVLASQANRTDKNSLKHYVRR